MLVQFMLHVPEDEPTSVEDIFAGVQTAVEAALDTPGILPGGVTYSNFAEAEDLPNPDRAALLDVLQRHVRDMQTSMHGNTEISSEIAEGWDMAVKELLRVCTTMRTV